MLGVYRGDLVVKNTPTCPPAISGKELKRRNHGK